MLSGCGIWTKSSSRQPSRSIRGLEDVPPLKSFLRLYLSLDFHVIILVDEGESADGMGGEAKGCPLCVMMM
jgi:hypothetical protein